MNDYEMMVLDLDGTLLNSNSVLVEETKVTLQNCMKKGKKIALCSSRSYEEMGMIAKELYEVCEGQYCIGFEGALCYTQDGQCIVKTDPIEMAVADHMITLAEKRCIHIHGGIQEELEAMVEGMGFLIAYDGMELSTS